MRESLVRWRRRAKEDRPRVLRPSRGGLGDELGELRSGRGQADLQSLDFTEPPTIGGFRDALGEVVPDRDEPFMLGRIDAQQTATDAPLTELTVGYRLVGGRLRGGVASLSA